MKVTSTSLFLLCTVLCIQNSHSVRTFGSIEEFMQFYLALNNDDTQRTTTIGPFTTEGDEVRDHPTMSTSWWSTTVLSDSEMMEDEPEEPETPRLLVRCCHLGRRASNEQLNCRQFANSDVYSNGRDQNRPGSNYRFTGSNPMRFLSNRHVREYETCTSSQADDLRHEFLKCCKENSMALLDGPHVVTVDLPHNKQQQRSHVNTRYRSGIIKKWPY